MTKKILIAKLVLAASMAAVSAYAADPAPVAAAETKVEKKETAHDAEKGAETAETTVRMDVPLLSPLFSATPVASVNGEPVTMAELNDALATVHMNAAEGKTVGKTDYIAVLNRIINARLIPLEAEAMGLQDLDPVKKQLQDYPEAQLREELKEAQLRGLSPDPKLVEKIYKETVKEWQVKSVRFEKEEDAKEFARQIQAGGDFDKLADPLIDGGKVQGAKEASYVKPAELLPQISAFLATAAKGAVSPVIAVGPAFTIVRLVDIRYPEGNQEAMAEATSKALGSKQLQTLADYNKGLKKRFVKINKKVFDKLDFEAKKPGFAALRKDKRVVAEIKGEKPVTVADLTAALEPRFFHGVDEAVSQKKVNSQKAPVLDDILYKRLYPKEGRRLGLDKTDSYKRKLREYRDSVLFGSFIEKAVVPELKVSEDDVKDYFNRHIAEYSYPEMMRIRSLVFSKRSLAESAAENLKKGAEFPWVALHADGQVKDEKDELIHLDGSLTITKNYPDRVRESVSGAKKGDIRIMETPEGYAYLLLVDDVVPAKPQALAEVKKQISQKVAGEKVAKSIDDWGVKLRQAYKVKIYISGK